MKKHSIVLYSADTPLVFGLCGIVYSVCLCRCTCVQVQRGESSINNEKGPK